MIINLRLFEKVLNNVILGFFDRREVATSVGLDQQISDYFALTKSGLGDRNGVVDIAEKMREARLR